MNNDLEIITKLINLLEFLPAKTLLERTYKKKALKYLEKIYNLKETKNK